LSHFKYAFDPRAWQHDAQRVTAGREKLALTQRLAAGGAVSVETTFKAALESYLRA
jgi:hypothetical protein